MTVASKFIAFTNNHTLVACFTCPKPKYQFILHFHPFLPEFFYYFNLLQVNSYFPDLKELNVFWADLNERRWDNFGYPMNYRPFEKPCEVDEEAIDPRYCITLFIAELKNCTYFDKESFMDMFGFVEVVEDWDRFKFQLNIVPVGGYFRGLKYFVVLGDEETLKGIQMSMGKILKPVPPVTWLLLSTVVACIVFILSYVESMTPFKWLYMITVQFLEQGETMLGNLKWRSRLLVVLWLLGTILLRNLYSFSMYAHLTAPVSPQDLPQTRHEFFLDNKLDIRSYWGAFENMEETSSYHDHGFYRRVNPKLLQIEGLYDHHITYEVLQNLSNSQPIICSEAEGKSRKMCDTSSRFALIYFTRAIPELRLALGMTSSKVMYHPPTQSEFYMRFYSWTLFGSFFLTKDFISHVGYLQESGIVTYLQNRRDIRMTVNELESFEEEGLIKSRNIFAYTVKYKNEYKKQRFFKGMAGESKQSSSSLGATSTSTSSDYTAASMQDLGSVFSLLVYLLGVCLLVQFGEMIWILGGFRLKYRMELWLVLQVHRIGYS